MEKFLLFFLLQLFCVSSLFAAHREINLIVGYKTVYFAGKPRQAMAVNNQIPAPTLYFKRGDQVTINVYNHLAEETAIHWHGVLVPWQMDGVLGVNQRGIPPGKVFRYQFTLRQAGTYWYHAHAGLQEQQGLYGAFIIDPLQSPAYSYTADKVVVLSDWSNTHPEKIFANLKKDGDYYSPYFPLQASLSRFLHDYGQANARERKALVADYQMMQQMRMGIYDINDVAYDTFLLNGQSAQQPWISSVKVGDIVRLRFIGASASTIFRIKIHDSMMQMVHVDGNDVQPYSVNDFTIAPGETFDVLVRIQQNKPYIIYAESTDKVSVAYGVLVPTSITSIHYRQVKPFADPLPITREMMIFNGSHTHQMAMGSHHVTVSNDETQVMYTKYKSLRAAFKTNDPHQIIYQTIHMDLNGWMDRFIWFIDGVPGYQAKPILLKPNKRYRIIFKNNSMMHHPMHIHGHWFILRKGLGAYDPLLHTIDIPPGATIITDIDTDASGQWFFHCHMLYHMMAGMSRVFQYSTIIEVSEGKLKPEYFAQDGPYFNRPIIRIDEKRPIDVALIQHPMAHSEEIHFATALDIGFDPFHHVQEMTFKGLYGGDYHKLELLTEDAEINQGKVENADVDIFYWHLLDQFWAIKGGINYFYRPAIVPYWQLGIGVEGFLPYFIDVNIRAYYYAGSAKLDAELARDTQITNNFFITLGIRGILATTTVTRAQLGYGLNQTRFIVSPFYRLMSGLNIFAEYEYTQNDGAFKNLQLKQGESAIENTLSFGLSFLF